jgi:hypothetical protein
MFTQKPIEKKCAVCDTAFITKNYRQKYCSPECKVNRLGSATCKQCGKTFPIKANTTGELCSSECWYEFYKEHGKETKICPVCDKIFHGDNLTCGSQCGYKLVRIRNRGTDAKCQICEKSLLDKKPGLKFCSRSCSSKSYQANYYKYQNGDKKSHPQGYILLKVNNSWVLEHRYLLGQSLGRPLHKEERVHHKNGIRSDNRLENLELWSIHKKDPPGSRISDIKQDILQRIVEEFDIFNEEEALEKLQNIIYKDK